jgi:hypothetical protein
MEIHATGTWPAREDRRAAMVWLAIFWTFVSVGFGFDLHNYFHEQPPVPKIVHVHAIATTLWLLIATALVLLVEAGNVHLHRRFGWFAAGYAALICCDRPLVRTQVAGLELADSRGSPSSISFHRL